MNNIFEEYKVHMSATVDVTESSHFQNEPSCHFFQARSSSNSSI